MPLSYNQYTGDGVTKAFNIDFDYIDKSHVHVRVDGVEVPFTWLDTYRVQTATAPALGAIVDVRRVTPRDEILVEFMDGSVLVETDLNLATIQSFFLAQEAFDQGEASLAVTPDGHYSAGLRRITLVMDPVNDRDVVTKQWALNTANTNVALAISAKDGAVAAKNDAISARNAAQSARDTANNAANTATTKASEAAASATTAEQKASLATAKADQTASDAAATAADRAQTALDRAAAEASAQLAADRAATLGAISVIPDTGEVHFKVGGVTVAKFTASGDFLVKGDIGIHQSF